MFSLVLAKSFCCPLKKNLLVWAKPCVCSVFFMLKKILTYVKNWVGPSWLLAGENEQPNENFIFGVGCSFAEIRNFFGGCSPANNHRKTRKVLFQTVFVFLVWLFVDEQPTKISFSRLAARKRKRKQPAFSAPPWFA